MRRGVRLVLGDRSPLLACGLLFCVAAACAPKNPPGEAPLPDAVSAEPEADGTTAEALPESAEPAPDGALEVDDVDALNPPWADEPAQPAGERPQQTSASVEESVRREYLELFGPDPVGLALQPETARYEIPLEVNEKVLRWINYFQNEIPDRFGTYLERTGRYGPMIRRKLRAAGLPEDLIYLALIESGMNPRAYSRARAVGMWQFIRSTGRMYGLRVDYWEDDRRDPIKATDAALAHLSDLYDDFGSWYLAAAAYNAGSGRVRRALARTGTDDYWGVTRGRVLRAETRNYVPKLIAAAIIAKDPERYGFGHIVPEPELEYDIAEVPDATSFDVLAEAAGTDEETIRRLNPQFPRRVTPPDRRVLIRVPPGMAERFAINYAALPPDKRVTWLVHTVTRGQTLGYIAGRYGTTVSALRAANGNVNPRRLRIGQQLIVPRAGQPAQVASRSTPRASSSGPNTVTVRRGDTLWSIARRYSVSTRDLMAWNNLSSTTIHPGDRLTVSR